MEYEDALDWLCQELFHLEQHRCAVRAACQLSGNQTGWRKTMQEGMVLLSERYQGIKEELRCIQRSMILEDPAHRPNDPCLPPV